MGFDTAAENLRAALRAGVEHVKPRMHGPKKVVFRGWVIEGNGSVVKITARKRAGAATPTRVARAAEGALSRPGKANNKGRG
jgi:hypothetical protein